MVHDSEPISCPWPRPAVDWTDLPALQYAAAYLWFVIASALDLIVTGLILHVGGAELNGLANMILATGGMAAMIVYKFCLVVLIVIVNEQIGRLRYGTAGEWPKPPSPSPSCTCSSA